MPKTAKSMSARAKRARKKEQYQKVKTSVQIKKRNKETPDVLRVQTDYVDDEMYFTDTEDEAIRINEELSSETNYSEDDQYTPGSTKGKYVYTNDESYRSGQGKSSVKLNAVKPVHRAAIKRKSIDKYEHDEGHCTRVKQRQIDEYKEDEDHHARVNQRRREKYTADEDYRARVKERQREKYTEDEEHRSRVKERLRQKYAQDEDRRRTLKQRITEKYAQDEDHRMKLKQSSKDKYAQDENHRMKLKQSSKDKYAQDENHRLRVKKSNKDRYGKDDSYQRRTASDQYTKKKVERADVSYAIQEFHEACSESPLHVCCVCERLLFRKQVILCDPCKYKNKVLTDHCITYNHCHICTEECSFDCPSKHGPNARLYICKTCNKHLIADNIPPQAAVNNLAMSPIPERLATLNTLEEQLIAITIPFMKVVQLPKGQQRGVKGPVVCVLADHHKTTSMLPRPLSESQIVPVKLKRKLEYKGHVQYKLVDLKKVENALSMLKNINHLYSDVHLHASWSNENDKQLQQLIADLYDKETHGSPVEIRNDREQCAMNTDDGSLMCNEGETIDNLTRSVADTVNDDANIESLAQDSCLQPLDIRTEVMHELDNHVFSVAPSEGKKPHSLLHSLKNEEKAFPTLFPYGQNGYDEVRDKQLSRAKYFNSRLWNADLRFARHSGYIFYAQATVELERLLSGINIHFRKGTKRTDGRTITAALFTDKERLRNILKTDNSFRHMQALRGSPEYWKKTMSDLFAMIRQLGIPTWFCTFSAAELSRWPEVIETIAIQNGNAVNFGDLDFPQKCEILRSNPVTAVRMFYHRVESLMRLLKSPASPLGKIVDLFYRVEFQQRGSPHIHCLFWVQNAPKFETATDGDVCTFVDQYIRCQLPSMEEDPELYETVSAVQTHSKSHTKSCRKGKKECRFHFPKPISLETTIVRPCDASPDSQNPCEMSKPWAQACLEHFAKLLSDEDELQKLNTPKLLQKAGFSSFEQYLKAMSLVARKSSILMKRDKPDIWVNNYNPALLRAWNANMDIQYVMDAYSCVMYILSYISKAEHELGELLKEAKEELQNDKQCNDLRTQMKKLGFIYFENREVSVQEAVVRVTSMNLKQCSRNTVFIPTDENPVRMSKPLLQIMQQAKSNKDSEDVWMTSLYDKYLARPKNADFEKMCQATFASHYTFLSNAQGQKKVTARNCNVFRLQNNLGYIQNRTTSDPAIIRFPKFSSTKNPEKHHMSLLKLYLPHRTQTQLKPVGYTSYEEFYKLGAVQLSSTDGLHLVKTIVTDNRCHYEKLSEHLQEVWETLETHGPLEDAWAQIAPQSEQQRFEETSEQIQDVNDPCGADDIPDLINTTDSTAQSTLCSVELIGEPTRHLLRTMNSKQRRIFYYVRQWCIHTEQGRHPKPFHLFVSGGAGVGKSHLIKCIYNESSKILRNCENPAATTVLLTSPTGTAAFNIAGFTLHSALKIPRKVSNRYEPLSDETLTLLSTKLGNLKIIIIDEISMVDRKVFAYVHGRLKQIKQIRACDTSAWFGNVAVLAVGDFYQLPPVKAKSLVKPDSSMGIDLWHDLFVITELTEIMRQKDDRAFAELLNVLRTKPKSEPIPEEYNSTLENRTNLQDEPANALHVFAKNADAHSYNLQMLENSCTDIFTIRATDYVKQADSGKMTKSSTVKGANDDLADELKIATGARVILTRNLDTADGLVNGAFGTVAEIKQAPDSTKSIVYVLFDNERVGKNQTHELSGVNTNAVAIKVHEENMAHIPATVRRQIPLKLAWACTIHKTQGMTVDKCVVDMKGIFAPGQAYVALSRVTSLTGLYIQNYNPTAIYMSQDVHSSLKLMNDLQELPVTPQTVDYRILSVTQHNVQGLHSKVPDIRNDTEMHTDVIIVNETWLKSDFDGPSLDLKGYKFYRRDRPNNTGKGGVGMYVCYAMESEKIETCVDSLEHLVILTKNKDACTCLLGTIYRPPTHSLELFYTSLRQLLSYIETLPSCYVIIAGDFNENLLSTSSHPIYDIFFHEFGYAQHVQTSTTRYGSLLDAVYSKSENRIKCLVVPKYFSDHDAVNIILADKSVVGCRQHEKSNPNTDTVSLFTSFQPEVLNSEQPLAYSQNMQQLTSGNQDTAISNTYSLPNGMVNSGTTCYINSILQALFSLDELLPLFQIDKPISSCLFRLRNQLYAAQRQPVFPKELFKLPQMSRWPAHEQQDAHEFLSWLFQELHLEHMFGTHCVFQPCMPCNSWDAYRTENMSAITDTVCSQVSHTYTCTICQASFTENEFCFYATVYLSTNNVNFEPSNYPTQRPCRTCHATNTVCDTKMVHCPPVLVVLLVRFHALGKNTKRMNIPQSITTKDGTHYMLAAVVNHEGSSQHYGHYTSLIYNTTQKVWFRCDDQTVRKRFLPRTSSVAYILFYR